MASDEDAKLAQTLSENVAIAQKPMVLIADFPEELRVVNDDGSVEELETNEETTPETPILQLMN